MWHFMKLKENNFLLKQLWGPCRLEGCLEAVSGPQGKGPFWKTSGNCTSNSNTANQVPSCLLRNSSISGHSVAKKGKPSADLCHEKCTKVCVCVGGGLFQLKITSTLKGSLQNSTQTQTKAIQAFPSPLPLSKAHSFNFKGGLTALVLDSANQVVTQSANQ